MEIETKFQSNPHVLYLIVGRNDEDKNKFAEKFKKFVDTNYCFVRPEQIKETAEQFPDKAISVLYIMPKSGFSEYPANDAEKAEKDAYDELEKDIENDQKLFDGIANLAALHKIYSDKDVDIQIMSLALQSRIVEITSNIIRIAIYKNVIHNDDISNAPSENRIVNINNDDVWLTPESVAYGICQNPDEFAELIQNFIIQPEIYPLINGLLKEMVDAHDTESNETNTALN